jgi:hypothetical protein
MPVRENDHTFTIGLDWNGVYRDRYSYQRQAVLDHSLLAWRLNPLARSIVELFQQYTVDGIEWDCAHAPTRKFLSAFWDHPLNQVADLLPEWADEYCLTGNAFILLSTDSVGMSYVRIYPTDLIAEIRNRRHDVRQETSYLPKATAENPDPTAYFNFSYKPTEKYVMLHSAVNRLAGMKWGESDLAPLLPWLGRYASWLEDRVRLNRFRNAFMYDVELEGLDPATLESRKQQILMHPPQPGSLNVHGPHEKWSITAPQLSSADAERDGLALKKFIAAGRGIPLHYLAEPESATRTTAEAAGTPAFKRFERRQQFFLRRLQELLLTAVKRRFVWGDTSVDPVARIEVRAADVSERDNAALALATSQIAASLRPLVADGLLTPTEYLRWVYRFGGEVLPAPVSPATSPPDHATPPPRPSGVHVDAESGDVRIAADSA